VPGSERLFHLRSIDSARGYAPRDDRRCLLNGLRAADRIVLTNTRRIQASRPISRAWDRHRRRNGLASRRDGPCVAVLLDANLRGRLADDTAAALARRNIPFVFVTGYGREALPESFGQSSMLTKPFTQEQLVEAATQLERPFGLHARGSGAHLQEAVRQEPARNLNGLHPARARAFATKGAAQPPGKGPGRTGGL
jgi:CheY-like chemotaxis protein